MAPITPADTPPILDMLNGLNSVGKIAYEDYSALFDEAERALADAWDEGFEACNANEGGFYAPGDDENPYRKSRS